MNVRSFVYYILSFHRFPFACVVGLRFQFETKGIKQYNNNNFVILYYSPNHTWPLYMVKYTRCEAISKIQNRFDAVCVCVCQQENKSEIIISIILLMLNTTRAQRVTKVTQKWYQNNNIMMMMTPFSIPFIPNHYVLYYTTSVSIHLVRLFWWLDCYVCILF